MPCDIVILTGSKVGKVIPLQATNRLGRSRKVEVFLPDEGVSQEHCLITVSQDTVRVRDLESTNGVLLNGDRVRTAPLHHGDILMLGQTSVLFRNPDDPGQPDGESPEKDGTARISREQVRLVQEHRGYES